ncbi:MAG: EVE domain-containing protein [Exiguobacterium profundum]|nr:MAG: EVE domain-containing protein [Exiguobacterium profundum]
MTEPRYWVVTASSDHAARGRTEGIVQACHGKVAPLRRMKPGDGVVIYSPRASMQGGAAVQAFTAIGLVREGAPYIFDMGGGFTPWRRGVDWQAARPAPIRPLLGALELTRGQASWGMAFRYGLRELSRADFEVISAAMAA